MGEKHSALIQTNGQLSHYWNSIFILILLAIFDNASHCTISQILNFHSFVESSFGTPLYLRLIKFPLTWDINLWTLALGHCSSWRKETNGLGTMLDVTRREKCDLTLWFRSTSPKTSNKCPPPPNLRPLPSFRSPKSS